MDAEACLICGDTATNAGRHPSKDSEYRECRACGRYYVDDLATPVLRELSAEEKYSLSASIRRASDSGAPLEISTGDIDNLIASARQESLLDKVDRLLMLLVERAPSFLGDIKFEKKHDYPLIGAAGPEGMNELLVIGHRLGYLDLTSNSVMLTIDGWIKVDALRSTEPESRQAFVAMWFDKEMESAWKSGFKPGIEQSNYFLALRIDNVEHNEKIDDQIIAEIKRSGLLVADFTGGRGGVYYEAGFAHGLGVPVIWTCRQDWVDRLHFDTRQYNHIVWGTNDDLTNRLHDRISATVLPRGQRGEL